MSRQRDIKAFKVVSVSSNRNDFGLSGMILMARDGEAYEVGANDLSLRKKGEIVHVPFDVDGNDFGCLGFEIPRKLEPSAPPEVVKEVWDS